MDYVNRGLSQKSAFIELYNMCLKRLRSMLYIGDLNRLSHNRDFWKLPAIYSGYEINIILYTGNLKVSAIF